MLNLSIALQNIPPADNSAAAMRSGSSGAKEPATEDFGKVLEREVSETTNKQKRNDTASVPDRPEKDDSSKNKNTADTSPETPADGSGSFIQNLLNDTSAAFKTIPSSQAMGAAVNPDATIAASALPQTATPASPDNPLLQAVIPVPSDNPLPQTATPASPDNPLPQAAIPVPSDNPLPQTATPASPDNPLPQTVTPMPLDIPLPQDSGQITGAVIPVVNQMLQRNQNPIDSDVINTNSSSNNYWQFLGTADSAAYGKFALSASELNEVTQIDSAAQIFKIPEEPVASPSFGLNGATAVTLQNTVSQDIKVDAPVGQHKWGGEFAQKVVWLSTQQHQVAEIRLNPAHLGPVEVMLSIAQDQATAQFVSPHPAVRDAIQEALPRLREMMAENGIQLGNVTVGSDSFPQENKQQQAFRAAKDSSNMNNTARQEAAGQIQTATVPVRHQGLVNTYA